MKISNLNINPINQAKNTIDTNKTDEFKKILESVEKSNDTEKLKEACNSFEEIFTNILLKNMRRTVIDGELLEKSYAREIFEEKLDEEIASEVSKGQGIGLSNLMYEQLSKNNK